MSIRSRLIYAFGGMLILILIQLAVTFFFNYRAETESGRRIETSLRANTLLAELQLFGQQARRYEKEYFIYVNDPAGNAKYRKEWSETFDKLLAGLAVAERNEHQVFESLDLAEVRSWRLHANFYGKNMKDIFRTVEEGAARGGKPVSPAEVNVLIKEGKDRLGVALASIGSVSAKKTAQASEAALSIKRGFTITYIALAVTALIGTLLALRLIRRVPDSIMSPIKELTGATDRLTKGDLQSKVSSLGVLEFKGLAESIERMRLAQQMMLQRLQRQT